MKEVFFMVYAEGQGAPTFKHEDESKATNEAERLAEKLGVETTVMQAVKTVMPKDITKRVKTYADACKVLGLNPAAIPVVDSLPEKDRRSIIAYYKLTIIIRALNEGWEPNWNDWNEDKYFNWFYSDSAGFGYAYANDAPSNAPTTVGSRLCYKNATLARYASKKFEGLYLDYLFIEIPKTHNNNSKK